MSAPTIGGPDDCWETSGGGERRSAVGGWWMLAVFFCAAVLSYTDRFIFSLLVDPVRAELGISDTQVSLLQGLAFVLIYAFAGLLLGRVADIVARRGLIIAGVLVWSMATMACGFAHSFGALFIARVFVGMGEAALAPAAVSMITDYFPLERRGLALGVFIAGMAIGGGAAITIGGALFGAANQGAFQLLPLVGALPPWRATLVMLGIPGVVVALLLLTVSEPPRGATLADPASGVLPLRDVISAFGRRGSVLLPLYLALALLSAADFAFQNWTPALLTRRFGLTPMQVGNQLGALSMATGVLGTLAGGWLGDWRARVRGERARLDLALLAIVLGVGGAAIALGVSTQQILLCFALWSLAVSCAESLVTTALLGVVPAGVRGVGVALVSLGNMLLGLGCGTTLTAVLTDYVFRDRLAVGWSMSAVMLPAALVAFVLLWRVRGALR